jgi:hypothetical protein
MVLVGSRTLHELPPRRIRFRGYIKIPLPMWGLVFFTGFLIALTSYDPWLTFSCIAFLPLLATVIWRVGEPPVAFAALLAQWLQVSVGTLHATVNGVELNDLMGSGGANYATWLSLAGLFALALGIRVANINRPMMDTVALHAELQSFRYSRVLAAYCLAQGANLLFGGMIWTYPGLAQALLAATQLRWVFFFILVVTSLVQKRGYVYLAAAVCFEILLGFTSFFSDFRVVFFVFSVAYLMVRPRISARMLAIVVGASCVLLFLAVIWSAIKVDYRAYQNQGTGGQISMVGPLNKLETLSQLIGEVDSQRFVDGLNKLAERVEYTKFFGDVTENVPRLLPYDDGAIWGAAIYHIITPRLLFPDKAELTPDKNNTIRYTGHTFAGGGEETEIPMGYMAESYIGFGPIGMFLPIFFLGLLLGYEYRFFATRRSHLVFAYGLTPVFFLGATSYESTAIKILGGNLTVFIVAFLAWRFAVPIVQPWLANSRRRV